MVYFFNFDNGPVATRGKVYIVIVFAEYAFALIAFLALLLFTILRRRRVSPMLRKPFTLLLVSEIFFFL
jgi:hypothetical protein